MGQVLISFSLLHGIHLPVPAEFVEIILLIQWHRGINPLVFLRQLGVVNFCCAGGLGFGFINAGLSQSAWFWLKIIGAGPLMETLF